MDDKLSHSCKYLDQALTCPKYAEKNNEEDHRSLATIGDALLSFLFMDIVREIIENENQSSEYFTDFKELIQDNEILNQIGKNLFIGSIKSYDTDELAKKSFATTLEAYIYALYLCEGIDAAKKYIKQTIMKQLLNEKIKKLIFKVLEDKKTKSITEGKDYDLTIFNVKQFIETLEQEYKPDKK
ncbi:hypothetical protein KHQ89_01995 [Mycoplasmatota bacterium]|nr:hypothetical protein KHQ89_01995 [Mycoplasmatota bacterium]